MREIFRNALSRQLTIVLTSHSMEECEYLCHRLAIMSKGQLQCLANIQDLKDKFGQAYFIEMKFHSSLDCSQLVTRMEQFLQSSLEICHQTEQTILLQIDSSSSSPAKLFSFIEQIKEEFHIETYSIQQTTLEQIFLSFQHTNQMSLTQ